MGDGKRRDGMGRGLDFGRTTGRTTLQGSSMLTRKLLKISTWGLSLSPLFDVSSNSWYRDMMEM